MPEFPTLPPVEDRIKKTKTPYKSVFDRVRELAKMGRGKPNAMALSWLKTGIAKTLDKADPSQIVKDPKRMSSDVFLGKLCMFFYDPKWKKELPYYDKFPLILPLNITSKGFTGINFHYLPPKYRIVLLQKLEEFANNTRWDVTTKLKATYEMLASASKFPEIAPCFKQYLASHVRSKLIVLSSYDWEISVFLPVERFEKESKEVVWRESVEKMNKRKNKHA